MLKLTLALGAIWLTWWSGSLLANWVPLPGPLLGLLILFVVLLGLKRVPTALLQVGQFALKHLSLFFIPITVGIVSYRQQWWSEVGALALALIFSTLLSMGITAWIASRMLNEERDA